MRDWLRRWLGRGVELDEAQRQRLANWRARPQPGLNGPLRQSRCVVVDVETTGLNLMHDRLISIGAVALVEGRIALNDSFYVVLQQRTASGKENILLHGIGTAQQLEGVPPVDALLDFLEYLGDSPLVAFHVTFDETMIRRAMSEHMGFAFRHAWLDLAYLMPALNPPLAQRYRSLDDWVGHAGIRIDVRHNALADALATAQLLQVAQAQAGAKGISDLAGLRDLEQAQRWVSRVS